MPGKESSYTVVQLAVMDPTGDSYYRMRWPAAELAAQAPEWRVINLDARAQERHTWALEADLTVLYQSSDPDLLPLIRKRKEAGKKTLVEYNDNFYEPPPASTVTKEWSSPLLWQSYERCIDAADGLIVTGPGLEELFSARFPGKAIHVLENHYPEPLQPFDALASAKKEHAIGWAGSLGHMADFLSVLPVLRELLREFPRATLHVMGNDSIPSFLRLPPERVVFTNWGSIFQYYDFWKPISIGIAPLLDTPYNRCRSDIKAVEMAALGVTPLVAKALPYRDFCSKTECPTFGNHDELTALLRNFLKEPARAKELAKRCHSYVAAERIGPNSRKRLELYEKYLPAKSSTFAWPQALGYHEVIGTKAPQILSAKALQEAQTLQQAGKSSDAIGKLKETLRENPDVADVALALTRMLFAAKSADAPKALKENMQRFPKDLRFRLLDVSATQAAEDKQLKLESLLAALHSEPARYRRFFRRDVTNTVCQIVKKDPSIVDAALKFITLYPEALMLRFVVAEALERCGRDAEASAQFAVLKEAVEAKGLNEQALAELDESYVSAWSAALKARTEGK